MKTKIRECFGLLVFVLTMLSLTSCEVEIDSWYDNDDYSEVYYRKTHELCSRTWQESWEQDGNITLSDWTFMKIGPEKTIYEWSIEMAA